MWEDSWKRWPFWALTLSLVFNACFVVSFALGEMKSRRCAPPRPACKGLTADLNLDAGQREASRRSSERLLAQVNPLRREIMARRKELVDLLAMASPDDGAISGKLAEIAALQNRVQKLVVANLIAEKESLRPDQRELFDKALRDNLCPQGMCSMDGGSGTLPAVKCMPGGGALLQCNPSRDQCP